MKDNDKDKIRQFRKLLDELNKDEIRKKVEALFFSSIKSKPKEERSLTSVLLIDITENIVENHLLEAINEIQSRLNKLERFWWHDYLNTYLFFTILHFYEEKEENENLHDKLVKTIFDMVITKIFFELDEPLEALREIDHQREMRIMKEKMKKLKKEIRERRRKWRKSGKEPREKKKKEKNIFDPVDFYDFSNLNKKK